MLRLFLVSVLDKDEAKMILNRAIAVSEEQISTLTQTYEDLVTRSGSASTAQVAGGSY